MLFFYTVIFYDKDGKYNKEWGCFSEYINDKSDRYLGLPVSKSQWDLLKIHFKDYPEPGGKDILENRHISGMIEIFHDVFGETDYELRMYGIEFEEEMKIIDMIFDDTSKFMEIIGTSNGLSIVLCNWLAKSVFNRKSINRKIVLSNLI